MKFRVMKSTLWMFALVGPIHSFFYFCYLSYMTKGYLNREYIRTGVSDIIISGALVWLPFNLVAIKYVAPHYRVLASNFYAILWQAYASFVSNEKYGSL
mmetsp:Transcript_7219/g.7456  ORF Transcript_7219/g.7456 Transcript_7219/m.7456 type:complete len:99 (+) Transcript_7219:269-565(+)